MPASMDGKAVGGGPSGDSGARASKEGLFGLRSVSLNSFIWFRPSVRAQTGHKSTRWRRLCRARALIASSSSDKTVKVHAFNASDGSLTYMTELKGHSGRINAVGFVPGQPNVIFFSGSEDGRLVLWDAGQANAHGPCLETGPNPAPFLRFFGYLLGSRGCGWVRRRCYRLGPWKRKMRGKNRRFPL